MTEYRVTEHSWVCPSCDRQVPLKVTTCRCGHVREETPSTEVPDEPGEAGSVAVLRMAAVVLLGGLACWYAYARWVAAPPGGTAAISQPAATTPAPAPTETTGPADGGQAQAMLVPAVVFPSPARSEPLAAAEGIPPATVPAGLEEVVSRAMGGVVRVEAGSTVGSGFFTAPDTVITNVHVVSGSSSLTIRRADGTTSSARVTTSAPEVDIAILSISSPVPGQTVLPLGSVARVRVGQEVLAAGSPLGVLQNTVTRGIVSAFREVGHVKLIQTDAAINPGNSGGPLLNRNGEVIGITTMSVDARPGLSFAVAADHVQALLLGQRSGADTDTTPLASLNRAMTDRGASTADAIRDEGTRNYEQAMTVLASRADSLDREWERFKGTCYSGVIVGSFDREWFALYEPQAMPGVVASGCHLVVRDWQQVAAAFRADMASQEEAARRNGVYPGVRRDLSRRLRLDYAGWDR
jgi:S1-C subfamily serine protease